MKLKTVGIELAYSVPVVLVLWILAYVFGRNNLYSAFLEQGSYFKNILRRHEIQRTSALKSFEDLKRRVSEEKPQTPLFDKGANLCVAILSMNRQGNFQQSYLTRLVMSLVTRMDWKREDISISILNMESNLADHKEANELGKYFRVKVPLRNTSDISPPEQKHGRPYDLWKETIDYMAALDTVKHCRYALILEDDALAALDWDQKIDAVIKDLERNNKILYAKLYFPYKFLGWGLEWHHFLTLGALAISTALMISFLVGSYLYNINKRTNDAYELCESLAEEGRTFRPKMLGTVSLTFLIANFVGFYHAIGRQHIFPPSKGFQEHDLGFSMTAVLYPQLRITGLLDFYRDYLKNTPERVDTQVVQ